MNLSDKLIETETEFAFSYLSEDSFLRVMYLGAKLFVIKLILKLI